MQPHISRRKKGNWSHRHETNSNEFERQKGSVATHLGILGFCAPRQDTATPETRKPGKHQARECVRKKDGGGQPAWSEDAELPSAPRHRHRGRLEVASRRGGFGGAGGHTELALCHGMRVHGCVQNSAASKYQVRYGQPCYNLLGSVNSSGVLKIFAKDHGDCQSWPTPTRWRRHVRRHTVESRVDCHPWTPWHCGWRVDGQTAAGVCRECKPGRHRARQNSEHESFMLPPTPDSKKGF